MLKTNQIVLYLFLLFLVIDQHAPGGESSIMGGKECQPGTVKTFFQQMKYYQYAFGVNI